MLLLVIAGLFALQYSSVQTYVSKKVAAYLSRELQTHISVSRVYLKPFRSLELQDITINDRQGAPLISSKRITAKISLRKIFEQKVEIHQVTVEQATFNYEIYKDSTNISFLAAYFTPQKEQKDKSSRRLEFALSEINLIQSTFSLTNHQSKPTAAGVDFGNLRLTGISGTFTNIQRTPSAVSLDIRGLTFKEQSGLYLRELSADSYISTDKMEFANLRLRTNRSTVGDYLAFYYDRFSDFGDFVNKVKIEGTLNGASVDSRDIAFFAPAMEKIHFFTVIEQASVNGTVAHASARNVILRTGSHTELRGAFTIDGLPLIEQTHFDFDLESLRTSAKDVERLVPELSVQQSLSLPQHLHQFGTLAFEGRLSGLYHQFDVDGTIRTDLGTVRTVSNVAFRPQLHFHGSLEAPDFKLGELIKSKDVGNTAIQVKFDGKGSNPDDLHISTNGTLRDFVFNSYRYRLIDFEGEITKAFVYASGQVNDANASLAFDGEIDWTEDEPTYSISSTIDLLNLKQLNLFDRDSIVITGSNVQATLQGNSLNSMNGHIISDHLHFRSSRGEFTIGYVDFESRGDERSKQLTIQSEVVDGVMSGQIDLNTVGAYFESLAMRYAPAINIRQRPYEAQNFDLQIHIKSFEPISALFDPHLRLESGARLSAQFSSADYTAKFKAFSPVVSYKGVKISNLSMTEEADDRAFSLDVTADRLSFFDSTYIDRIHINNVLANDSLRFAISMSEEKRPNYLNLNGNIHFAYNKPAYIRFEKSDIVLNQEQWTMNQDAELRVSKGKFYFDDLRLTRDRQEVALNGILSNENDNLDISFKDFSLTSLSGITKPLGIDLIGHLSGDIRIHAALRSPNLSAHISTTPIIYNNLPVGNLTVNADFDPQHGVIQLDSRLSDIDGKGVTLEGTYDLRSTENGLRLRGKAQDVDIGILSPFVRNLARNLYGKASGDVTISGSIRQPKISGTAQLTGASFIVDYLQTRYAVANQMVIIEDNSIVLKDFRFTDVHNTPAITNGTINLNHLSDPTLRLHVTAENFQILNTGRKDNELFFGKAYASGDFRFRGPASAINIDISARSNANTAITLPFNSSLRVSETDFIYFVNSDSTQNKTLTSKRLFKGLTMNMDLSITPDAEISLENNIGSLKSTGTGNISLRISSLGDFEMFGDYHVSSGKFHFTAQDFINKFFDLKEGGTIRWAGNPAEAVVNLSATYQQRTSIAPLYNAAGRTENNSRILAQADMNLRGTLSQPEVSFDLNFPQDPYVKDELQGYFSDLNNVNQQAISLIVRRSFTPASTQEFGREVNNTLLSAGTEIAFNQLNSIISQSLNMNFLDLNIRSFNDASASLRFFDDRLVLTGGVSDRSKNQVNDLTLFSDQIATDAEITFRLRQDGNLVLRAYNRLNTRNFLFTPYSDYISAVGLVYRQEFNSLSEFWRKLWIWNERKRRSETKQNEDTPTPQ